VKDALKISAATQRQTHGAISLSASMPAIAELQSQQKVTMQC